MKAKIIRMYLQGATVYKVAQTLDITEAEVVRVLERAGYIR